MNHNEHTKQQQGENQLEEKMLAQRKQTVTATSEKTTFGVMYFVKAAAAGGICCSLTHGAVTPLDVVKTRIQLDPIKYNKGFIGTFGQVISAEGTGALLTGLGATATGYFVQGWVSCTFSRSGDDNGIMKRKTPKD